MKKKKDLSGVSKKMIRTGNSFIKTKLLLCGVVLLLSACAQPLNPVWPGAAPGQQPMAAVAPPLGAGQWGSAPTGRQPVVEGSYGGSLSQSSPPGYPFSDEEAVPDDLSADGAMPAETSTASDGSSEAEGGDYIDPEDPVEDWLAQEGMDLRFLMQDWGDRAGWRVVWDSNRKYVLKAGAMFRGRFVDVTSALVRAFSKAIPPPYAVFYKGNRVVVVKTLGHENAD